MALFGRKKRPGTLRESTNADTAHLEAFAASRQGVEPGAGDAAFAGE